MESCRLDSPILDLPIWLETMVPAGAIYLGGRQWEERGRRGKDRGEEKKWKILCIQAGSGVLVIM